MVVDCLDRGAGEEPHGLSVGHASDKIGNPAAQSIQKKSFKGVVVEGAICIGHVKPVMASVERCYKK